jgi:hypothetical protein
MTYEPDDNSRRVASRSRWLTPKPRHYRSLGGSIDAFIALIALVGGGGMLVTRADVRVGLPFACVRSLCGT